MANPISRWLLDRVVKPFLAGRGVTVLPRLVTSELLGREYTVRNGTVDSGDYDDAWMLALAFHSRIIFDLGSNIGQSAFLMLHAPNVQCVLLVDASPLALTIAADTMIRNHLSYRARFYNAFVADTVGMPVEFTSLSGSSTGGHQLQPGEVAPNRSGISTIPTTTIDHLVDLFDLIPDLVKIDIVDYERQVLDGCSILVRQRKTRFLIEMHRTERKSQRQNTQEILEWCTQMNYTAWYLKEAVRLISPDAVEQRGRYHLLLQPNDWEYPANLAEIPQKAPIAVVPPLFAKQPANTAQTANSAQ